MLRPVMRAITDSARASASIGPTYLWQPCFDTIDPYIYLFEVLIEMLFSSQRFVYVRACVRAVNVHFLRLINLGDCYMYGERSLVN